MDKKIKIVIIGICAVLGGLVIWHFTGLYKEGKVITEQKLNRILEENK